MWSAVGWCRWTQVAWVLCGRWRSASRCMNPRTSIRVLPRKSTTTSARRWAALPSRVWVLCWHTPRTERLNWTEMNELLCTVQWRRHTRWVGWVGTHLLSGKYIIFCVPHFWVIYTLVNLILKKISKIGATRCQILRLKCTKIDFGCGSAPDPAGGP